MTAANTTAQTTLRTSYHLNVRRLATRTVNYTVLGVLAFIGLFPLLYGVLVSASTESGYIAFPPQFMSPLWGNYIRSFTMIALLKYAENSLFLSLTFAILTIITSSMCGFAFARVYVPFRDKLFQVVVSLLMIPYMVYLIPQFMVFSLAKLTNTYWPWVLWGLGSSPFFIFMFRQFFTAFPKELEDAAEIDGANLFRIYWQVFLPNAKPVMATAFIFAFNSVWGDYLRPILYLPDAITTLAVKLSTGYITPTGFPIITVTVAASVLYSLPMIIAFFVAQKQIMKGVITTGMKG
jgi:ABC-type glycerol-3-phosphate transport system permease component